MKSAHSELALLALYWFVVTFLCGIVHVLVIIRLRVVHSFFFFLFCSFLFFFPFFFFFLFSVFLVSFFLFFFFLLSSFQASSLKLQAPGAWTPTRQHVNCCDAAMPLPSKTSEGSKGKVTSEEEGHDVVMAGVQCVVAKDTTSAGELAEETDDTRSPAARRVNSRTRCRLW